MGYSCASVLLSELLSIWGSVYGGNVCRLLWYLYAWIGSRGGSFVSEFQLFIKIAWMLVLYPGYFPVVVMASLVGV
jgi:hypothetical protein